jgi:hypothetical protein
MRDHLNESSIRLRLLRYLDGTDSLRMFRQWFVPSTWNVEEWASPRLQELVYSIKLLLAEYTSGHRSEEDLRARLSDLLGMWKGRVTDEG